MNEVRAGYAHPTKVMRLAKFRQCTFSEDEIYGLKAAAEVTITPAYGIGVKAGLAKVVGKGNHGRSHFVGAAADFMQQDNTYRGTVTCIMPSSAFRFPLRCHRSVWCVCWNTALWPSRATQWHR